MPFMIEKINLIRLVKPLSDNHKDLYFDNVYVILDYKSNWLMFVYPTYKYNKLGQRYPYPFADHYSVPYNSENIKKPIQFHQTRYVPSDNLKNDKTGSGLHKACHFKDNIILDNKIFDNKFDSDETLFILDFLQPMNWLSTTGGGKESLKRSASTRNSERNISRNQDIYEKWIENKIDDIFVFGMQQSDNKYSYTAYVHDTIRRRQDEATVCFFFTLDSADTSVVKRYIINWISNLN